MPQLKILPLKTSAGISRTNGSRFTMTAVTATKDTAKIATKILLLFAMFIEVYQGSTAQM